MPYIELQAVDGARASGAAGELAAAVASALGLPPEDVLVSVTQALSVHDGTGLLEGWPSAVLHGRRRDVAAMDAAREAATEVLVRRLGIPAERVWVHWCTG